MRQIVFEEKMIEVTDQDFFWIIQESLKGTETLIHNLCGMLKAWPDVIGKWSLWIQKDHELITSLAKQVEDFELKKDMFALEEHIQKIDKLNEQLTIIVSQLLECSSPDSQEGRHKLLRKMNRISEESGPMWAMEPKYQKLYSTVNDACQTSRLLLQKINQILDQKLIAAQKDEGALSNLGLETFLEENGKRATNS